MLWHMMHPFLPRIYACTINKRSLSFKYFTTGSWLEGQDRKQFTLLFISFILSATYWRWTHEKLKYRQLESISMWMTHLGIPSDMKGKEIVGK